MHATLTHGIVGILDECVDRQQRKIRLTLSIVDQIQVHKLLQFQVVCNKNNRRDAGLTRVFAYIDVCKFLPVWMQLITSVKSVDTSFPIVILAMTCRDVVQENVLWGDLQGVTCKCHTFLTASLLRSRWGLLSSSRSSWFSPLRLVVKNLESVPPAFLFLLGVRKFGLFNMLLTDATIQDKFRIFRRYRRTSTFTIMEWTEGTKINQLCLSRKK